VATLLAALFIAAVSIVVYAQRRPLARAQALILGGSVVPGCVVAEAIVLVLIAAVIAFAHFSGLMSY
jgi:uncharacterized membrane protein YfcA